MLTSMGLARTILLLLAATVIAPRAQAIVLYKSVSPSGVVEFSDQPPAGSAKLIEQRDLGAAAGSTFASITPAAPASAATPSDPAGSRAAAMEILANDAEVMRASEQVDLAEHALALARREIWSPHEGLRLTRIMRKAADDQRIEHFKRGVVLARQNLLEVMKRRASALAVPGTPYVTAIASR
jgi:hypothetical protein